MKILRSERGLIPIPVIIAIAIVSLFCGAGLVVWLSGSAKRGITLFIFGVICGLVVLPNLQKIIKWGKSVKNEFKK